MRADSNDDRIGVGFIVVGGEYATRGCLWIIKSETRGSIAECVFKLTIDDFSARAKTSGIIYCANERDERPRRLSPAQLPSLGRSATRALPHSCLSWQSSCALIDAYVYQVLRTMNENASIMKANGMGHCRPSLG